MGALTKTWDPFVVRGYVITLISLSLAVRSKHFGGIEPGWGKQSPDVAGDRILMIAKDHTPLF